MEGEKRSFSTSDLFGGLVIRRGNKVIHLHMSFKEEIRQFIGGKASQWINAIHWEKVPFIEKKKITIKKIYREKSVLLYELCFQSTKYTVFFFNFHSGNSPNNPHTITLAKSHKFPIFEKKHVKRWSKLYTKVVSLSP